MRLLDRIGVGSKRQRSKVRPRSRALSSSSHRLTVSNFTPQSNMYCLEVEGILVHIQRKRIKNMNLQVKAPDGAVQLSAPLHTSDTVVASFVKEKRSWIEAKREQIVRSPSTQALCASPDEVAGWRADIQARVPDLLGTWQALMGVKAGKITYRNMTTRWGSCQPATGRITLNVKLALYPPECLEYVLVHELCHLREHGHGARFKDLMDTYLPDWRKLREKLR